MKSYRKRQAMVVKRIGCSERGVIECVCVYRL